MQTTISTLTFWPSYLRIQRLKKLESVSHQFEELDHDVLRESILVESEDSRQRARKGFLEGQDWFSHMASIMLIGHAS
jgi:hypothetical protein